ncbi:MAG: DNA translocase FtsK [Vicinamibacterales bacterium]
MSLTKQGHHLGVHWGMDEDRRQIEAILDALETFDDRIEALAEQISEHRAESVMHYEALRRLIEAGGAAGWPNAPELTSDELYAAAEASVIDVGKASTSYLQRRLGIGYARAATLMDMLFAKGVIGPADGSKPRTVLIEKASSDPEEA